LTTQQTSRRRILKDAIQIRQRPKAKVLRHKIQTTPIDKTVKRLYNIGK